MKEYEIINENNILTLKVFKENEKAFTSIKKLIKGNPKDVLCKLNILQYIKENYIDEPSNKSWYVEPFCGIGISQLLFKGYTKHLNDYNPNIINNLKANVGERSKIHNLDSYSLDYFETLPNKIDICFFDFDSHTFKSYKLKQFVFINELSNKSENIIYTDNYPFSMKPFNELIYREYLTEVNQYFKSLCNKYIQDVFVYPSKNTAIFIINGNGYNDYEIIYEHKSFFQINEKGGFDF